MVFKGNTQARSQHSIEIALVQLFFVRNTTTCCQERSAHSFKAFFAAVPPLTNPPFGDRDLGLAIIASQHARLDAGCPAFGSTCVQTAGDEVKVIPLDLALGQVLTRYR